jgi:hypothetical protein
MTDNLLFFGLMAKTIMTDNLQREDKICCYCFDVRVLYHDPVINPDLHRKYRQVYYAFCASCEIPHVMDHLKNRIRDKFKAVTISTIDITHKKTDRFKAFESDDIVFLECKSQTSF